MTATLILSGTVILVTAMLCLASLSAWRGWLDLRRDELARNRDAEPPATDDVGARIELAAVKERLKKLEAIASGVEL